MKKNLQVKHYKQTADIYDRGRIKYDRDHMKKIKAINDYLDLQPNSKVLEVGVGTGIHAKWLLDHNKGKRIKFTGVDASLDMLAICKKRLASYNVNLLEMDGEELKFADNSFDAAYISSALHHFTNYRKAISELIRCTKSKFVIMEPNWLFPSNFLSSITMPVERGKLSMRKNNFRIWLNSFHNISYSIVNFIYTPPLPKQFFKFYDYLDSILAKIPLVRDISLMIFIRGQKL